MTGNPVVIADGNKVKTEIDFKTHHAFPLSLIRTYNHYGNAHGIFGKNWTTNLDESLTFSFATGSSCSAIPGQTASCATPTNTAQTITVDETDGSQTSYTAATGTSQPTWTNASVDATDSIILNADNSFTRRNVSGAVENFNGAGFISSIYDPTGIGWMFAYSGNYLQTATHSNGENIQFKYTNGVVSSLTDPAGNTYSYTYNSTGYLSGVTYPGAVPNSHTRTYFYENSSFPSELTGIAVDGFRYSTYSYNSDSSGTVYQSGLYGGVEQLTFQYNGNDSTTMTNAANVSTTNYYSYVNGRNQLTNVAQSGVTNCPTSTTLMVDDSNGHPQYSLDRRNIKTTYVYSANGLIQSRTDGIDSNNPNQTRMQTYGWDSQYRLTANELYDSSSNPIVASTYAYYPSGSSSTNWPSSMVVTNLSANGVSNQTHTTNYSYTIAASKLPSQIVVGGYPQASTRNYDSYGNLTSLVDAGGNTTTYTNYNGLGEVGTVTSPNGYAVSYTYDLRGEVLTVSRTVDRTAGTTTYQYNGMGMVVSVVFADGAGFYYTYDNTGRMVTRSNGADIPQQSRNRDTTSNETYTYNNLGVLTNLSGQTNLDSCAYTDGNNCGEVTTVLYTKTWAYDSLGRLTSVTGNNGQNFQQSYDANGNIATRTDSTNKVTTYSYNAHDQVQTVTDPLNNVTKYAYDGTGNLASVTDPKNNVTQYAYDGFGNLVAQTSPDTGKTTAAYDGLGRISSFQRADGTVTSYSGYDTLNRPTSIQTSQETQSFTYDSCSGGHGLLCSFSDSSGSTSYSYRVTGQVASQTQTINSTAYTTSWAYDNRDRVSTITYPGGNSVAYAYTGKGGEVGAVTATIGGTSYPVASGIQYVAIGLGPMASMAMGDNSTVTMAYDKDLRMTSLGAVSGSTTLQSLTYAFDTNNNITGITNGVTSNLTQTYAYDLDYRLNSVTAGIGNQSVTFDANGNRSSYVWTGATDTYSPDTYDNRIASISGSRARSFSYDQLGNLHTVSGWNGNYTYNFDSHNRMSSLVSSSGTTTYGYNTLNQRVRKSGPGGSFSYIYDPSGILLGETASGGTTLVSEYIWLNGQPIGLIRSGTLYYVHNDHLGRPDTLTNASASVVWRGQNTAFTSTVGSTSIGSFNLGFLGQYLDSESGLWYNGARYYDSTMSRYVESDPIGLLGGINTYAYASLNPVGLIDPDGFMGRPPGHSGSTAGSGGLALAVGLSAIAVPLTAAITAPAIAVEAVAACAAAAANATSLARNAMLAASLLTVEPEGVLGGEVVFGPASDVIEELELFETIEEGAGLESAGQALNPTVVPFP